ncbi:MFS transporter [Deinococcus humi]|uniref:DHA1 family multidrug resistance protein-like MFS transporter n=1 Tax=Deinococcus humi TaxID=662880 RepID=A0A7W8NG04_9DEIO|nr:MFS transporter [Deinococcus humi]MBB5366014.1 DHA1 family multidrug resistance protein-like MFS transporter [Deinococcus humi]GGO39650.1 tetracycline resistance MFS efflux pump [Deinococcus humi]
MINKHLLVLLTSVFVVMIGLGITMPVLPFYVERLGLASGVSREIIVLHVTLLTGVYALMQLLFAPVWGRWSDRVGRRPLILIGVVGFIAAQVMFGLSTSLWTLYAARVLGGILSSATLPVAAAYVADLTSDKERVRGMAWLGTSVSLGFVVGPALAGVLSRTDLHFNARYGHIRVDNFSVPFFVAALLGLMTVFMALRWLPESLPVEQRRAPGSKTRTDWRGLRPLLGLALAGQFGLAVFEATFALYAQTRFEYGLAEVGVIFVVCGLVMAIFQVGAVGFLAGRVRKIYQVGVGFGLMGLSLLLLGTVQSTPAVITLVALLALGTAFVSPNLAALISQGGGQHHMGAALGIQNAANSLGQVLGPLLGGALLIWQVHAPYVFTGSGLLLLAMVLGWRSVSRPLWGERPLRPAGPG